MSQRVIGKIGSGKNATFYSILNELTIFDSNTKSEFKENHKKILIPGKIAFVA